MKGLSAAEHEAKAQESDEKVRLSPRSFMVEGWRMVADSHRLLARAAAEQEAELRKGFAAKRPYWP